MVKIAIYRILADSAHVLGEHPWVAAFGRPSGRPFWRNLEDSGATLGDSGRFWEILGTPAFIGKDGLPGASVHRG